MGAVSNNSGAAAVLLSILLIIDARHGGGEMGKLPPLFFRLQGPNIKCKRNSHQIQFGTY